MVDARYKVLMKSKYVLNIRFVGKLCAKKYKRTYVAYCVD